MSHSHSYSQAIREKSEANTDVTTLQTNICGIIVAEEFIRLPAVIISEDK